MASGGRASYYDQHEQSATKPSGGGDGHDRGMTVLPKADSAPDGALRDFTDGASWVINEFPMLSGKMEVSYDPTYGENAYTAVVPNKDGTMRPRIVMGSAYSPENYEFYSSYDGGFGNYPQKNSTTYSVTAGTHEATHALMVELANRAYGNESGMEDWERSAERVKARNQRSVEKEIVNKAYRQVTKSGEQRGRLGALRESISPYASENYSETVAEAFASVRAFGDNATPFAKAIFNETKKYAERYA